ncbi:MAG: hypothetical protein HZC14_02465 [Candidatus Niyogibacteria bacterium]|nr:hypothetical protein [Candidatus Niyogibacteria bacterium]
MLKEILYTKIAYAASANTLISGIKQSIINPIITFFMVAATVVFIWGVVEMIMGAENEAARTTGKQHIIWGLLGLFIMIAAGAIISTVCLFFGLSSNCS